MGYSDNFIKFCSWKGYFVHDESAISAYSKFIEPFFKSYTKEKADLLISKTIDTATQEALLKKARYGNTVWKGR